jgi:hypothetical protein
MPDPDDEADRIENSGGLLEQWCRLMCLINSAEFGTQMRGTQQVGLGRPERFHRSAVGGRQILNGGSAPLDNPKPKAGKRTDSRADKMLKPNWRPRAHRCTIDPWRDSRHRRDNFNRIRMAFQELADDDVGLGPMA